MRNDLLERKEDIVRWIAENKSKAFIANELKCNPKTINPLLQRLDLSYKGNQGGKGQTKNSNKYIPLLEYLSTSKDIQSNKVRIKLLKEGYKEYRCEHCGLTSWQGQPIPLELHHKDGNRYNNTLENFELCCPNCHAQTDSWRGKNSYSE